MAELFENYEPYAAYNSTVTTNKNVSVGGTLAVTGASTFTGVATFTASPVFNGGRAASVVPSGAATVTITAAQSGSTFLFDSAAGVVYTLPTPAVGLEYTFITTVTITSAAAKIVTAATGTQFLLGNVDTFVVGGGTTPFSSAANGTNIAALSSNGTTTGGIIGGKVTVIGLSATQWYCYGVLVGSGTLATPFAAS